MKTCENIEALARELKIQRKLLYTWKYQFEGRPEPRHANLGITAEDRKEKQLRDEITKLKSALADKTLENVAELKANGMVPSMSRPANPYDNAVCESFMKTLKQEEIRCHQYRDFQDLSEHLEEFIETYYNRLRLHSALGYRTPEEFERDAAAAQASGGAQDAAVMKYFTPKVQEKPKNRPPEAIPPTSER
jgi:hypothetical protein